jgi:hypothetical protein
MDETQDGPVPWLLSMRFCFQRRHADLNPLSQKSLPLHKAPRRRLHS